MTTLIVDANNLGFRKIGVNMVSGGKQIGIAYLFIMSLWEAIDRYGAERCIIAWDRGRSVYRTSILPDYKGNRPEPNEISQDVFRQLRLLESKILPHMPVIQVSRENTEADDIIYASVCAVDGDRTVLLSSDSDFYQICDRVTIWNGSDEINASVFQKKFGFEPSKYVLYKSMVGDQSDKIKGITGIGQKTATVILTEYESLEKFVKSDNPRAHLLKGGEAAGILERNSKLIDLSRFPKEDRDRLREDIKSRLENECVLNINALKTELSALRMFPLIAKLPLMIKSFRRLEK